MFQNFVILRLNKPAKYKAWPNVKENTKSYNLLFEYKSHQSLNKTQHCLSQDVSNKCWDKCSSSATTSLEST